MMRKTRFWRYDSRSSFLTLKSEMPFSGQTSDVSSGNVVTAASNDSLRLDRRAGRALSIVAGKFGDSDLIFNFFRCSRDVQDLPKMGLNQNGEFRIG